MCYAFPGKVISLDGETATIDYLGVKKNANISFIEKINLGDYVLVHAGFAIEKVDKKKAIAAQESMVKFNEE